MIEYFREDFILVKSTYSMCICLLVGPINKIFKVIAIFHSMQNR